MVESIETGEECIPSKEIQIETEVEEQKTGRTFYLVLIAIAVLMVVGALLAKRKKLQKKQ